MGKKRKLYPPPTYSAPVAAARQEIRRQLVELNEEYELELDALVLWTLHKDCGFGLKRLRSFYEGVLRTRKEMHHAFSGAATEYEVCKQSLKEYGFDLDLEYETLNQKYRVR